MPIRRRTLLTAAVLAAGAVVLGLTALPRDLAAETVPAVYAEGGVAIRGTDPVAYFTDGAAIAGDPAIHADWNGARWLFASEDHRSRFVADPAAYAPQFGGYCAWAVAQGYSAPIDPEAWRIVDGRLYLNYSQRVQRKWEKDVAGNIRKAAANWPAISE